MTEHQTKIPKRRFKGFAGDWEEKKLGEVVSITMGQSPNSVNYTDNPSDHVLVQGNADMNNNRVVPRVWTTQVTKQADKGDLILSVRAPVGDVGKTDYDVVIGRGVAALKGNEFIYQYLVRMKEYGYWTRLSTGSTFESINSNDIKEAIIMLPSLEEQQKIGEFFSQLDERIELQKSKIEKMKALKKAYLSEMFPAKGETTPKRRFKGFTDPWEEKKLGDMGETFTGLNGKSKSDFGHGDARYITYLNVFKNEVADLKELDFIEIDSTQREVQYGDVLFTTSSEIPEEVGMSSVWLGTMKNIYLNSFCFGYRPVVKINPYFLAFILRSPLIREKIILLAQGISRYNISKTKVLEIMVPIPSLEEQQKIGEFFSELNEMIELHEEKLKKLQDLKQAYLNELLI